MIEIMTKALGAVEIDEKQILEFPYGIPGFEKLSQFALLDSGQPPFYWLQSTEDVEVAFILIDPMLICPEYRLEIGKSEYQTLDLRLNDEKALLFAIVTVRGGGAMVTANLQGPVVINRESRRGRQFISTNPDWDIRYNIMDALRAMSEEEEDADLNQKEG